MITWFVVLCPVHTNSYIKRETREKKVIWGQRKREKARESMRWGDCSLSIWLYLMGHCDVSNRFVIESVSHFQYTQSSTSPNRNHRDLSADISLFRFSLSLSLLLGSDLYPVVSTPEDRKTIIIIIKIKLNSTRIRILFVRYPLPHYTLMNVNVRWHKTCAR